MKEKHHTVPVSCRKCHSAKTLFMILSLLFLLLVGGILYYRSNAESTAEESRALVVESITSDIGKQLASSLRILTVEEPDSAYGVYYFNATELSRINDLFLTGSMKACDQMTAALSGSDEEATNADFEYFKVVAPKYQQASTILSGIHDSTNFSGWKVRSVYTYDTPKGVSIKMMRYSFLDAGMKKVEGTLDIPFPRETAQEKRTINHLYSQR